MTTEQGTGADKKSGKSLLHRPEQAFVRWGTPKIPKCIETYHLTFMTLAWSGLNLMFAYMAKVNLQWLWMVSLMIVLQYLTDLFDGAVGRTRNTGLIKWGYFMDHFLDYIFIASYVAVGYIIAPPVVEKWYVFLMVILGAFEVNSYLTFGVTNKFQISHFKIGPTEMRIVFIILNTILIFTGTWHFRYTLPALCGICSAGLIYVIYRSHKALWEMDMKIKQENADRRTPS
jgi:archaetidylinositol phosphate synthase